jgi:hypothetical protein
MPSNRTPSAFGNFHDSKGMECAACPPHAAQTTPLRGSKTGTFSGRTIIEDKPR